jgi:hypothetical protein
LLIDETLLIANEFLNANPSAPPIDGVGSDIPVNGIVPSTGTANSPNPIPQPAPSIPPDPNSVTTPTVDEPTNSN